ncbi:uncharacterized protein LOC132552183 [Ylistrum balloti]|uniref:uncharacterized protein LOC132552183 n=1 Tax=Ylistrum balloti TaxID=509963 RepID=UPI002905974A|nr:uncharacterized protein LOC132552183 [Ylistrum balloti]
MTNEMMTILVMFFLLLRVPDSRGSECSDAAETVDIPYIQMCEDGEVTSHNVILDTYEAADTGGINCSCDIRTKSIVNIYIEHYGNRLNPNTSNCGSEIVVNGYAVNGTHRGTYKCDTVPKIPSFIRPVTMAWNVFSDGDSKYCFNITGLVTIPNSTFTIKCSKPEIIATSSFTTSETTTQTTKITETTPTTNKVTTTAMTNVSNTDNETGGSTAPTSSVPVDTSTSLPAESFPLIIVVPAAVGGFVLIVIIIIIAVVCHRKHDKYSKGINRYIDEIIDPFVTSNSVANNDSGEDSDSLKLHILYNTSGRISANENSTVDLPQSTSLEAEYSQVKKSIPKQNEEGKQNETELSNLNGTGNDLCCTSCN